MELPRYESEGAPAGVKDAADEGGGGPAGVVDGLLSPRKIPRTWGVLAGVEGSGLPGGLESTINL